MTSKFEDDLTWMLQDFKNGKRNFRDTIIKIEGIIIKSLGLTLYRFNEQETVIKELTKQLETLDKENKQLKQDLDKAYNQ